MLGAYMCTTDKAVAVLLQSQSSEAMKLMKRCQESARAETHGQASTCDEVSMLDTQAAN